MKFNMNRLYLAAAGACSLALLAGCGWNKRCKDHSCSDHMHKTTQELRDQGDVSTERTSGPHVQELMVTWPDEDQDAPTDK